MNEDVETIRCLVADHDPAAGLIGPDAYADPRGRATLERILATPTSRTHRGGQRSRSDAILRSVVAVALAATFVVLVVRAVNAGSPALAATPTPLAYHLTKDPPSGREVLLGLAASAARQPAMTPASGSYAYVKTAGWYLNTQVSGGQSSSRVVASTTESWLTLNGSGRSITRRIPGDGSRVSPTATGPITSQSTVSGNAPLLQLSTDPTVMAHQLDIAHPTSIGPVERFVSLTDLALQQPIPPGARSAILRVLARSPGLIDSGNVIDRAGRGGVAVSLDSAYSGGPTRYTLILDPHTGSLLGEEETLLGSPGKLNVRPGAVLAYTAFLSSGYVDNAAGRP